MTQNRFLSCPARERNDFVGVEILAISIPALGENLRFSVGDENGIFRSGGVLAVCGLHGPAVGQLADVRSPR